MSIIGGPPVSAIFKYGLKFKNDNLNEIKL
jgi:hypothetical protein